MNLWGKLGISRIYTSMGHVPIPNNDNWDREGAFKVEISSQNVDDETKDIRVSVDISNPQDLTLEQARTVYKCLGEFLEDFEDVPEDVCEIRKIHEIG